MPDFNELKHILKGNVMFDVPMKEHTSMHVGGPCTCMITPADQEDILRFIEWSRNNEQRYIVMGAGTNIIVRDGGIKQPVIRIKDTLDTIEVSDEDNASVRLTVGAGTPLGLLVKYCEEKGLSGVEPLAGIPGTVGGAIYMNAGTRYGTISDIVETVTFIERTGRIRTLKNKDMGFGYRECKQLSSSSIVVATVLKLQKSDSQKVQERVAHILKEKTRTQPLNHPSSGSIFKNPPKVKAWKLLDEAGMRGVRVRGAKYSELHTNFIINTGDARAEDVLTLIDAGMEKVKEKSKIKLELEVVIVGEQ
ncbi:MAG: UDP-N-acetylmuramate dehydrogenase [bacterium]